jgi:hypothetical protein
LLLNPPTSSLSEPQARDAIPIGPQRLPVRARRLQLEHLTLLDHRRTSPIDNEISHPQLALTTTPLAQRAFAVTSEAAASPAILAPVGEIDPLGTRRDGLDAYLDQRVQEGYVIETRSDTHAIIFRRPKGLKRFTSGPDPGRYVVQVNEDGIATMRPAEPRRT